MESRVNLSVFDAQGRQVRVLADGTRSAGYHEVLFDARDLASGAYFYQLQTSGQTRTNQMLLIK